jgi:4'-phosphopantetheinyl transferase
MTKLLPLSHDEVHLWYVLTDDLTEAALLKQFQSSLCEDERQRWRRFSFEEGKRQYLVSHGFLRAVLSRYADVPPSGWRFVRSAFGRPEVRLPPHAAAGRSLCFNLTHTRGLAACAVAWDREVGIDAEDWQRQGRAIGAEMIHRCLSPAELECLRTLPPAARQGGFFDYWTLKEAYLKARGLGLSLPIEEITFRWPSGVPHEGDAVVSFGPVIDDVPHTWQFVRHVPTDRHKIAVAIRRLGGPDLDVVVRRFPSGAAP